MKGKIEYRGLTPLIEFFKLTGLQNYKDATKIMSDSLSLLQKNTRKPCTDLEEKIKQLYNKTLKKDYIELERHYYTMSFLNPKKSEKTKFLTKLDEIIKAFDDCKTGFDSLRMSSNDEDKAFSTMLKELHCVLEKKHDLIKCYNEIYTNGIHINRKQNIDNLNSAVGRINISVTMNELKETKECIELEINALLYIFGCLESISGYDHVQSITEVYKLKTAYETYANRFKTRKKDYVKNMMWQWIKNTLKALESRIAFFFNPFFISQALLLESSEEDSKFPIPSKEKKAEIGPLRTKFDLFKTIPDHLSNFACKLYVLLDKSLLTTQPTLIFGATEARWRFHKNSNLMIIYEYQPDNKFELGEDALIKLASLLSAKSMKININDPIELIEDSLDRKYKFFAAHIDVAVTFSIIASDLYNEKKYNERIKKAIKIVVGELRSYSIVKKLKESIS